MMMSLSSTRKDDEDSNNTYNTTMESSQHDRRPSSNDAYGGDDENTDMSNYTNNNDTTTNTNNTSTNTFDAFMDDVIKDMDNALNMVIDETKAIGSTSTTTTSSVQTTARGVVRTEAATSSTTILTTRPRVKGRNPYEAAASNDDVDSDYDDDDNVDEEMKNLEMSVLSLQEELLETSFTSPPRPFSLSSSAAKLKNLRTPYVHDEDEYYDSSMNEELQNLETSVISLRDELASSSTPLKRKSPVVDRRRRPPKLQKVRDVDVEDDNDDNVVIFEEEEGGTGEEDDEEELDAGTKTLHNLSIISDSSPRLFPDCVFHDDNFTPSPIKPQNNNGVDGMGTTSRCVNFADDGGDIIHPENDPNNLSMNTVGLLYESERLIEGLVVAQEQQVQDILFTPPATTDTAVPPDSPPTREDILNRLNDCLEPPRTPGLLLDHEEKEEASHHGPLASSITSSTVEPSEVKERVVEEVPEEEEEEEGRPFVGRSPTSSLQRIFQRKKKHQKKDDKPKSRTSKKKDDDQDKKKKTITPSRYRGRLHRQPRRPDVPLTIEEEPQHPDQPFKDGISPIHNDTDFMLEPSKMAMRKLVRILGKATKENKKLKDQNKSLLKMINKSFKDKQKKERLHQIQMMHIIQQMQKKIEEAAAAAKSAEEQQEGCTDIVVDDDSVVEDSDEHQQVVQIASSSSSSLSSGGQHEDPQELSSSPPPPLPSYWELLEQARAEVQVEIQELKDKHEQEIKLLQQQLEEQLSLHSQRHGTKATTAIVSKLKQRDINASSGNSNNSKKKKMMNSEVRELFPSKLPSASSTSSSSQRRSINTLLTDSNMGRFPSLIPRSTTPRGEVENFHFDIGVQSRNTDIEMADLSSKNNKENSVDATSPLSSSLMTMNTIQAGRGSPYGVLRRADGTATVSVTAAAGLTKGMR